MRDMEGLSIREAVESDWTWIAEGMVESAFLTEHPRRQATLDRAVLEKKVTDSIRKYHFEANVPDKAFIAEIEGIRVGLVWVSVTPWNEGPDRTTWLMDIYINSEHRGKGLATLLMEKAVEWSREQGATELWLNAGWSNERAIGLYRHLGFEIETVHMSKKL